MKKNRREFIKLSGMTSISLASEKIIPRYIFRQEKSYYAKYDKKLADKYGLTIPEPEDHLDPAPDWFQNIDMITADWLVKADMLGNPFSLWKGYRIELEDILVERIVRLPPLYGRRKIHEQIPVTINGNFDGQDIKGVAVISHVPHSEMAFKQAHEQGFRVIPYVHFSCIHSYYADQDVFLFQHPEILLKDEAGKWVHLPMDGTVRLFRFQVCANSPSYWKLSLNYIKKLMDWGADGVFIDNIQEREECYAPKFTKNSPEFDPYVHEHLFPDASHNYAFDRFLQTARSLVKSYGDGKVVVINSGLGTEFQKNGDCCMWESFIYSWSWEGRHQNHSWVNIKECANNFEGYVKAGRRITALSYLDPLRKEVKDDAYWAFCAARLVGMIWWSTLKNTGAEQLYKVHMGKSLQPLQEIEKIAYRTFENGIIVLNDDTADRTISIRLPPGFYHKQLLDLYDGENKVKITNGHIDVTVPTKTARIYLMLNS
jgi:hypothetical protein